MVVTKYIELQTGPAKDPQGVCIIDITSQVVKNVEKSGINDGTVTLFVVGSTAGITTIEYDPNLLSDFKEMWNRMIPQNIPYQHNKTWGDGNGHSHVRASTLGASLTVPLVNKSLTLGTWQQIVFVDFDNRPRSRRITVQILGE